MSKAEIRERLGQAVAVRLDRAGLGPRVRQVSTEAFLRRLRGGPEEGWSPQGLLERFRGRTDRFFAGTDDLDATVAVLRRLDPDEETRVCATADRILAGQLTVFGTEQDLGGVPDWTLEPQTGIRYPARHWSRIDYLRPEIGGEYKVAWEIARQQYLLDLGRAWAFTRGARYAESFSLHVQDWIRRNPPGRGIHWASSLEVAFRAISWLWALHLFRDSRALRPEFFVKVLGSLHAHGLHIERYLSTYFSPNTHLTGESLALFMVGAAFPELPHAERWRETGWRVLREQLPIQVREDGTYFEQSTAYARYNADFYLHLCVLGGRLGLDFPDDMTDRVERALAAMVAVTRPDGTTPYLGDDDGGRLLPVDGRDPRDQRAPLGTGALLYGRGDFKAVAGALSAETVWLMGPAALEEYEALAATTPSATSTALADGGLYVQRDGWEPGSDMLLVDCGALGTLNCGHAHADLLSIDVSVGGRRVLVDSGTYTYTAEPRRRDRFRSGSAHNALTVDGKGSSEPAGPFQWSLRTDGEPIAWRVEPGWCWFAGREAFPEGPLHDRGILFVPGRGWIVVDSVEGAGATSIELSFHLPPEVTARRADETTVEVVDPSSGTVLAVLAWPAGVGGGAGPRIERTQHSPSYRQLHDSQVVRIQAMVRPPFAIATVIGSPERVGPLIAGLLTDGNVEPGLRRAFRLVRSGADWTATGAAGTVASAATPEPPDRGGPPTWNPEDSPD